MKRTVEYHNYIDATMEKKNSQFHRLEGTFIELLLLLYYTSNFIDDKNQPLILLIIEKFCQFRFQ